MSIPTVEPISLAHLQRVCRPLFLLASPVSVGLDRAPRSGPVLFVGNHTLYGLIDVPMLGLEIYQKTGRPVRGLADHFHYAVPGWRRFLTRLGAVRGTRANCARLFEAGEQVIVFPGGAREVNRRKGEDYQLIWKQRIGFARMAIGHGVPIVPFASVGVDDMFEILVDASDVLDSPVGDCLRSAGILGQAWFRGGDVIPSLARGKGPAGLPRFERQYFYFGAPIDTTRFAGLADDRDTCFALRDEVQRSIERGVEALKARRARDPERYPAQRLLRGLLSRLT